MPLPRSISRRQVIAVSACLLVLIAGFVLRGQWLLYNDRQATLSVETIRVSALEPEGRTFTARVVAPNQKTLRLHAGDRLSDGLVKSIAKDHVIVEKEMAASSGKPPVKRLLRFALPQSLPPIPLGHDTTRITNPLLPDGTPDYGKWLNEKYGAGVTAANNAAGPLNAALAGLVDAGQTFFDGSPGEPSSRWYSQPWKDSDCRQCAERLRRNEAPLAAVAEAVRRPRYFVPWPSGARISDISIPSLLRYRLGANALAGRGMLRIGSGDVKGAIEDSLTGQRVAVLLSQSPSLIGRLVAIAMRGIGASLPPKIASHSSLSSEAARAFLSGLQALPPMPDVAETLDHHERSLALDQMLMRRQRAAGRGPGAMLEDIEPQWLGQIGESPAPDQLADDHLGRRYGQPVAYLIPASAFDWDEVLRLVNRECDLLAAAMRAPTAAERRRTRSDVEAHGENLNRQAKAVLETLRKSVRSEATKAVDIAEAAETLARTPEGRKQLACLVVPRESLFRASLAGNEAEAQFRLGVLAAVLAVHRLDKGVYPAGLDGAAGLLNDRLRPSAPWPGYVPRYRASPGKATDGEQSYALTAVPEELAVTGNRGFCVDSTGAMRMTIDGTAPKIVNGICDQRMPLVR